MKKEKRAGKGAGKRFCVFLAVLFFFAASTTGSLYFMQQLYGLHNVSEQGSAEMNRVVFEYLYEKYDLDAYFQQVIPYEQSPARAGQPTQPQAGNPGSAVALPRLLDPGQSSVRFYVETSGGESVPPGYSVVSEKKFMVPEGNHAAANDAPADGGTSGNNVQIVTVCFYISDDPQANDCFARAQTLLYTGERLEPYLPAITAALLSLSMLCCLLALRRAWQQGKQKDRRPDFFSLVPPDLYLCCVLPALLFFGYFAATPDAEILNSYVNTGTDRFLQRPLCMSGVLLLLLVFLLLTAYSLRRGGPRCLFALTRYERIPFARRTVAYLLCIQLVKLAAIALYLTAFTQPVVLFLLLEKAVTLPVIFRALRQMRGLMDNTAQFVQGDLSGNAAGAYDYATIAQHGADIDSIVQRISLSADEYVQSSNFKAELITNLSHDIKTPLTSIISYTQLLSQDGLSDADKTRYLSVLQRHSSRLQKLIEDLTDVSDAATGKVKVDLGLVDLGTLVPLSALGFEERLQKRGITLRFVLPEDPVFVSADQRLLWRVADNLMNNICKYARDDSEVRIAVIERDGTAAAIYRNVSAHELTQSGEALMERFVRADSARSSDGSGLGLSIAYSLMQLQGGKLALHTEGDVFTAQILFRD